MTYGYLRVSTDKQDMESQKIGVAKKSEELGLTIGEWIEDDGISGTVDYSKRKLGRLMEKLKEGDVIIISEISRLARTIFMLFRIIEFCNNSKIIIYSVKDSISTVKPNDLSSMMMIFCFGIAAQIEREMIVKRTLEGLERRRQAGVIFGRPVGCKTKKEYARHKEVLEQIKPYIDKGLGATTIGKILDMPRGTLASIMRKYGINSNSSSKGEAMKFRWARGDYDKLSLVPIEEIPYIKQLMNEGIAQKGIYERLKEKNSKITYNSVKHFIDVRPELKSLLLHKQNELRPVRNADCGKNKRHYRF